MSLPPAPRTVQRHSLLVVEDEEPCRRALTRLLAARGYTVHCVASAEEALELLHAEELPTHMVIDVDLPGISGFELTRRVRSENPEIQPMLVTAADRVTVQEFCDANEVDYFPKPLDVPRFLHHLSGTI